MTMLAEALQFIVENESFSRVYNEIRDNIAKEIGTEQGGFATDSWLAGMLASRGSSEGKLARAVAALDAGQLDPESKEYRDAARTKIAFQTLYRYGLVNRDEKGRFTFPSSQQKDARKRALLSSFRNYLSSGFNADKVADDTKQTFRNVKDEVAQEWAASLSPERKKLLDTYSQMSTSAFTLLRSLFSARGPAEVAEFRKRLNNAKFSDSTDLEVLRKLGFIGENNLLNRNLTKQFGQFMRDPDGSGNPNGFARLMPFNSELAYFIKRSTADKALARNAAGKTQPEDADELDTDTDTAQTMDQMSPDEERATYSRISNAHGGSKNSSRNERAKDQKSNFADMVDKAFA